MCHLPAFQCRRGRLTRPKRADATKAGSLPSSQIRGEWGEGVAQEAAMATGKKPLVVVTRKLPDSVETRMCELFDTRLNLDDKPMSQADLIEAAKIADVIVPTV